MDSGAINCFPNTKKEINDYTGIKIPGFYAQIRSNEQRI